MRENSNWVSLNVFLKDRNEALCSLKYDKIMDFYNKYKITTYPKDPKEFWTDVYTRVLNIPSASRYSKKIAETWLKKNGVK